VTCASTFLLSLAAAASLLTWPSTADASPEARVHFVWSRGHGAEQCPEESEILRELRVRLGRDPFLDEAPWSIRVDITHSEAGWVARVTEQKGDAPRTSRDLLDGDPSCAPIAEAAILVVALLIDPEAALRSPPPAPPPPPQPPRVQRPGPPKPLPRRVHGFTSARGVLSTGILPGFAPGLALSVDLGGERFGGTLGALLLPAKALNDPIRGTFAFRLTAAWFGGCWQAVRFGPGSLAVCGNAMGGVIHSFPVTPAPKATLNDPGDHPWMGLSVSPRLRAHLVDPLALEVGADLLTSVTRHEFTVTHSSPYVVSSLFTQPPVAGLLFVGVGASIP
jgi:hypothetical protein